MRIWRETEKTGARSARAHSAAKIYSNDDEIRDGYDTV